MEKYQSIGNTVEDAIEKGLAHLGITRTEAQIEIIDSGKKGFLGFGGRLAKVDITYLPAEKEVLQINDTENLATEPSLNEERMVVQIENKDDEATFQNAINYLYEIMHVLDVSGEVTIEKNDRQVVFQITTAKAGLLIGKYGKVLNAIQTLIQAYVHRQAEHKWTVLVDVEGYRKKRQESLQQKAINAAKKAKATNRPVFLEAMPAFERKLVHDLLQNDQSIVTHSEGEEPHRYLVIEPQNKKY